MRCARRNPSDARRRRDSRTDSDCRPRSPVLDRTTRSPNRIDRRRTVGNHRRRICTRGCARYGVADGDGGYRRRRPRSRSPPLEPPRDSGTPPGVSRVCGASAISRPSTGPGLLRSGAWEPGRYGRAPPSQSWSRVRRCLLSSVCSRWPTSQTGRRQARPGALDVPQHRSHGAYLPCARGRVGRCRRRNHNGSGRRRHVCGRALRRAGCGGPYRPDFADSRPFLISRNGRECA